MLDGIFICTTHNPSVRVRSLDGAPQRDHLLPLRFALPELSEMLALGAGNGMSLMSLHGAYDGAEFDEETSPAIIATFRRS